MAKKNKTPEEESIVVDDSVKHVVEEMQKIEEGIATKSTAEKIKSSVDITTWKPKTGLGKKIRDGEIKDINYILDNGIKVMETEVIDVLLPDLKSELLLIGQAKGKFGGGQRRVFKQTQKKTREGNKPNFATMAVVGNYDGFVGLGYGKSKETVPAREKAFRNAKLNVIKIRRGCGSWKCGCSEPHSIPFKVEGKCGSTEITLIPAPKGTGLCVERECAKILKLAGVKDVWSRTYGQTKTKINLIKACLIALQRLSSTKINEQVIQSTGLIDGPISKMEVVSQ